MWPDGIEIIQEIETFQVNWSPTANEIAFHSCGGIGASDYDPNGSIFRATAPDFSPINLAAPNVICRRIMNLIWSLDGQYIVFTGPLSEDDPDNVYYEDIADVWLTDRNGNNLSPVMPRAGAQWLWFDGWINDSTIVYGGWAGGGHTYDVELDIFTGKVLASGLIHGEFGPPNGIYISGTDGMGYWSSASAIVLDHQTITEYGHLLDSGPHIRWLGYTYGEPVKFNSHFEDWRSDTTQMLVLTWDVNISLYDYLSQEQEPETKLQLWDVATNELTPLVSGAFHGRFDPAGEFLSFLTVGPVQLGNSNKPIGVERADDTVYMNLLDMNDGQVIFSVPTFIYATDYSITHFDTFSPDSHYLAFLTPDLDPSSPPDGNTLLYLNIFDINNNELVLSLPSTRPNIYEEDTSAAWWSPTSEQFVYRDEQNNLAVVNVADGKIMPLTSSGGVRLSQPQWSYDGRYLSVTIYVDDNNRWPTKTAVILAPSR